MGKEAGRLFSPSLTGEKNTLRVIWDGERAEVLVSPEMFMKHVERRNSLSLSIYVLGGCGGWGGLGKKRIKVGRLPSGGSKERRVCRWDPALPGVEATLS